MNQGELTRFVQLNNVRFEQIPKVFMFEQRIDYFTRFYAADS